MPRQHTHQWARHRATATAALAGTCLLWLTGCTMSTTKPQVQDSSTPAASVPVTTAPVATTAPDGTTLPGTELAVGERAVVRYEPDRKHRAVLAISVAKVVRGKVQDLEQFNLGEDTKRSSVYYTTLKVRKLGGGDVSGEWVTVYGAVSKTMVVPPVTFASTFARCDYQPLPSRFRTGEKATLCMVMLAPKRGKISHIQWRPADGSAPISWSAR
ncbi:MAG: hypothetical protein H0V49_13370 [Nocardioidaceae bacterium]|nr:hypothetical protein [Nocardioidaceae bacterium]